MMILFHQWGTPIFTTTITTIYSTPQMLLSVWRWRHWTTFEMLLKGLAWWWCAGAVAAWVMAPAASPSGGGEGPPPVVKDLLLVGGGHSHVYVLKMWGMKPLPGVQLTLLTRDVNTPYSGMLPGHVAGHYTKDECHIDLSRLARFAGARLIHTEACGLDLEGRRVLCSDGRPPLSFDVVSIDIGSSPKVVPFTTSTTNNSKSSSVVTPVKPIDGFSARWDAVLERWQQQQQQQQDATPSSASSLAAASSSSDPPLAPPPAGPGEGEGSGSSSSSSQVVDGGGSEDDVAGGGAAAAPFRLVVVGAGAGGVELALAMHHRLASSSQQEGGGSSSGSQDGNNKKKRELKVMLVTRGDSVLPTHNQGVRNVLTRILSERGITVHLHADVASVEEGGGGGCLVFQDGRRIPFDECIWCTEGVPQGWVSRSGLALDRQGFILVDDHLQSTSHPGLVFAAGDIASMERHPRPKAGVFAVRHGPPLDDNLRRCLTGRYPLTPFTPQSTFLSLISTGPKHAVASKAWWLPALEGAYVWTIKDYIDRKFMRMYQELPVMPVPRGVLRPPAVAVAAGPEALAMVRAAPMRCGGCGSKVGSSILTRVLSQLRPLLPPDHARPDILTGLSSPDDAAVLSPCPPGMVTVHTVDFFRSFLPDPYVFGMVAANHALSDCHAMNAKASTALALAVVPYAAEDKMESVLLQAMAGACKVLNESGCALVGGHTSEGAELSLGFCINGCGRPEELLHKGGLRAGDRLVLTKGVGTGTIFAAEMRGEAKARWVQGAVQSMLASNRQAAELLRGRGGASACTDVTGFGLLGHLLEMLKASSSSSSTSNDGGIGGGGLACRLDLCSVPVLEGAEQCVAAGIVSSLQPQNLRLRRAVQWEASSPGAKDHPRYPLLFDPQTAGGLLAGVAEDRVDEVLGALKAAGYGQAAVVGQVVQAEQGQQQQQQDGGGPWWVILNC